MRLLYLMMIIFWFQDKMELSCVHSSAVAELMRCIRSQMESLISGLPPKEMSAMSLGLAHRLVVVQDGFTASVACDYTLLSETPVDFHQHSSLPLRLIINIPLWYRKHFSYLK